ncbi:MAG: T9SS type A sorting domain-containing protein [Bacteroidia bacterium]
MKAITNSLLVVAIFIFCLSANAQPWLQPPYLKTKNLSYNSKPLNFYEIQKAFNAYEKAYDKRNSKEKEEGEEDEGKFGGYNLYKRWESDMEPRVYPSGDITLPSTNQQEFQNYLNSNSYNKGNSSAVNFSGNWTAIGPTGTHTHSDWGGAARVNFIRFNPTSSNIMWTASPLGGLWKTIDGGLNWTTNTDQLPIIGCSDVAINPANPQIMYLATGDGNGTGSQLALSSIGILKSTDGGVTWPLASNTMNWTVNLNRAIFKLLINPIHPDTVFAATSVGIYRTINAGINWVVMQAGQFTDIEFKPGNTNIIYATSGVFSTGTFYKSTNGGATFLPIASGLPLSANVGRLEIAVTPADTNYVYLVAIKKNTYDFYGFYRSVDGGDNFTLRSNTPNILIAPGSSQAWYNLAMAVSPIHKDTILVGGTNMYKSVDGGLNWTKHTNNVPGLIPFVHPDHHSIDFLPGTDSVYFSGNDGGVWKTTDRGATWNPINEGLQISQMYKLGTAAINPNTILTGHQDMGTHLLKSNNWSLFTQNTGDGMECIFEHDNDTIMYLESYNGYILVTYNTYPLYNIVCNINGSGVNAAGNWLTPIVMNPVYDTVLLVGKAQVYRTLNGGSSFTQVGSIPSNGLNISSLAYAPSNPNFIYASKSNAFFVTTDGNSFVDRTAGLPISSAQISSIGVSNTQPGKVWVTFSGYSSANKVWVSSDTGATWSNYSTGLPNLPVNCITYQNNTNNALYVGTDVGVYFRSDSLSSWQQFFTGLPNVGVREMEISYSINKIRAATNGRGLWESDLVSTLSVSIQSNSAAICNGSNAQLSTTVSNGSGAYSYSWLPVAGLNNSTIANPIASPNSTTTYTVTVTEISTGKTATANFLITVNPLPTATVTANGATTFCSGNNVTLNAGAGFNSYLWSTGATTQTILVNQTGNFSVIVTNSNNCSATSAATSLTVNPLPTANITANGATTFCVGNNVMLGAGAGFNSYLWSNGATIQTVSINQTGNYSVIVTNANNCSATSAATSVTVNPLPTANITANGATTFCAGNNIMLDAGAGFNSYSWSNGATTQTISINQTGSYSVIITNANNCSASSAATSVTVNTLPIATITPNGTTTFCLGNNVMLDAGAGFNSYLWSTGATTQSISVNQTGNYSVTVTNANNCSAASAATSVTVNPLPTANITANGATTFCKGDILTLDAGVGFNSYQWSNGATSQSIAVTLSGTFTVTVTNANNCLATSTPTVVTVKSLPTATLATTGPTTFCSGKNLLTLTANAGAGLSYEWKKGASTIAGATAQNYIPTSTGTYKVVVIGPNGCRKNSTGVVATVNPLPSATITPQGPTTFCAGGSVTLAANSGAGYSYQWQKGIVNIAGATLQNYLATAAGTYKVIVTNANSCSKTSTGTKVTINCRLNETSTENTLLNIYPNPNDGSFEIEMQSKIATSGRMSLINVLGQEVYSEQIFVSEGDNTFHVDIESKVAGIYTLIIRTQEATLVRKISIE